MEFKGFLLFVQDTPDHLKELNKAEMADNIGLALLKGTQDESLAGYKINTDPAVKNTVIVYKQRKASAVFVNWTPKEAQQLKAAIADVSK